MTYSKGVCIGALYACSFLNTTYHVTSHLRNPLEVDNEWEGLCRVSFRWSMVDNQKAIPPLLYMGRKSRFKMFLHNQ